MISPADRFRERVLAYKHVFEGRIPPPWWARLLARTPLARWARFVLSDGLWLAIVAADLERFCHARPDQTIHVLDDPNGRESAVLEGRRQVYLRMHAAVNLTPLEEGRFLERLAAEAESEQRYAE